MACWQDRTILSTFFPAKAWFTVWEITSQWCGLDSCGTHRLVRIIMESLHNSLECVRAVLPPQKGHCLDKICLCNFSSTKGHFNVARSLLTTRGEWRDLPEVRRCSGAGSNNRFGVHLKRCQNAIGRALVFGGGGTLCFYSRSCCWLADWWWVDTNLITT